MHSYRLTAKLLGIIAVVLLAAAGCGGGSPSSTTEPAPVEPPPGSGEECDEFDGAFDAIQTVVFERRGCTASACHGSAASGGLDLRADVAFESLAGVPSTGSTLLRVDPGRVKDSYLFQKLAARTDPSLVTAQIAGSPMPLSGDGLSRDELEAVRLWIEAASPETGSIGDEFGGNRVADLLDACLPPPEPVEIEPLPPPAAGTGVQMPMPPHPIPAATEFEICFAEYIDFRERGVPDRFLTPDGKFFYANGSEQRSDPNTHHMIVSYSLFGADMVDAPEFGRWECAAGPRAGMDCDPLDAQSCEGAQCRTEIKNNIACLGFGPPGGGSFLTPGAKFETANGRPGFFARVPAHGIFYWNSHAFNLTGQDLVHHNYMNIYFTDDLRFEAVPFQDISQIGVAAGTPPFTKQEYCREYVLPEGTQLLSLTSHTHKRGERFTIDLKSTGERIYDNPFWDDPVEVKYDPPRLFDSPRVEDRTLRYCAVYNNGVAPDGSPDVGAVTRLSKKPARSFCTPVACAEGRVGEPCAGADDDATCDTSPGAGDGMCDACPITSGATSDDEMFVLRGTRLEIPE